MRITVDIPDSIITEIREGMNVMIVGQQVSDEDFAQLIASDIVYRYESNYCDPVTGYDPDIFVLDLIKLGYEIKDEADFDTIIREIHEEIGDEA